MEEKKTKEELKKIKILNRSMVNVSKGTQRSFDILSVQPEHGVFYQGSGCYVKIYSLKGKLTEDSCNMLVRRLCDLTHFRYRITSFCRNGERQGTMRFFSLFVTAADYYQAYEAYCSFEDNIHSDIVLQKNGLMIERCSLEQTLMFVQMNFTGQMKKFNYQASLKKSEDWGKLMFPSMEIDDLKLLIHPNEIITSCYYAKEVPSKLSDFRDELIHAGFSLQTCVEIQSLTDEEMELLNKIIGKKYNTVLSSQTERIVNASFLVMISSPYDNEYMEMAETLLNYAETSGLRLEHCSGQQKDAFLSICTLGIRNFHIMRNVTESTAAELIL